MCAGIVINVFPDLTLNGRLWPAIISFSGWLMEIPSNWALNGQMRTPNIHSKRFQIPGFFQIPQIFFFCFGLTTKWTQEYESSAFISWMFYSKNFQNFLYCIQILRQLSILLLLLALEGRAVFIFKCGGAGSAAVKLGFNSQVSWVGVGAAQSLQTSCTSLGALPPDSCTHLCQKI